MTRPRWMMLALLLGGCASHESPRAKTVGVAPQRWGRVMVAVALALAGFAPSSALAKPSRSLRLAIERAPGVSFVHRLNQSSDVGANTGRQGRRNAVYDESRAAQGPPNSFGIRPNN